MSFHSKKEKVFQFFGMVQKDIKCIFYVLCIHMSMELTPSQIFSVQKRLPPFELSYETIAHKKVYDSYQTVFAIPSGKKSFAWFSFHNDQDVCYMMDTNREKKITHISIAHVSFDPSLSLGTILYGTHVTIENHEHPVFVVEDLYYYKGISMKQHTLGEKLGYLEILFSQCIRSNSSSVRFFLPFLWGIREVSKTETDILQEYETHRPRIPYPVHHLQLRKLTELSPYFNISLNHVLSKMNHRVTEKMPPPMAFKKDVYKPQYKYPTNFMVSADIQYDIYHLFAFGKNKKCVYYDIAYIPNLKASQIMNRLFRNIRENENLDYIEESDDEDDFENIAADKYVDLAKCLPMECLFVRKFKRWVPIRVVEATATIVHISQLVNGCHF